MFVSNNGLYISQHFQINGYGSGFLSFIKFQGKERGRPELVFDDTHTCIYIYKFSNSSIESHRYFMGH
ncbi:hypothetical protein JHK86_010110 [Glycine max]|nr:hypothetical protein JHK86_010110 [Glycine max]